MLLISFYRFWNKMRHSTRKCTFSVCPAKIQIRQLIRIFTEYILDTQRCEVSSYRQRRLIGLSQPHWAAQFDARPTGDRELYPCGVGNIDHEIFSTGILSHLLIQEGQLSVSGERMCTNTG